MLKILFFIWLAAVTTLNLGAEIVTGPATSEVHYTNHGVRNYCGDEAKSEMRYTDQLATREEAKGTQLGWMLSGSPEFPEWVHTYGRMVICPAFNNPPHSKANKSTGIQLKNMKYVIYRIPRYEVEYGWVGGVYREISRVEITPLYNGDWEDVDVQLYQRCHHVTE